MSSKFRFFIPFAVMITCVYGIVYMCLQQSYRQNADDPQIQVSEDIADSLSTGVKVPQITSTRDISKSLAPFLMVFDEKGNLLATEGTLNSNPPTLPNGVLENARTHGQSRITWQPAKNIRLATVITYYKGQTSGFVLVARSLREVEQREKQLEKTIAIAWITTIGITFASLAFLGPLKKRG